MADSFKGRYSCSYTPVHTDEYTQDDHYDTSLNKTYYKDIVKDTDEAATLGGGMTIASDAVGTAGNVCGESSQVTTTNGVAIGTMGEIAAGKNANFVAFKILSADGSNADATLDCEISLDGTNYEIKLIGKGAAVCIPTNSISTSNIKFKSSANSKLCNIAIQCIHDA